MVSNLRTRVRTHYEKDAVLWGIIKLSELMKNQFSSKISWYRVFNNKRYQDKIFLKNLLDETLGTCIFFIKNKAHICLLDCFSFSVPAFLYRPFRPRYFV